MSIIQFIRHLKYNVIGFDLPSNLKRVDPQLEYEYALMKYCKIQSKRS